MSIINQTKTVLLLGLLTGLFIGAGYLLGGQAGMTLAFLLALLMNFISYWFSHKIVLFMYRAKPADKTKYGHLHRIVEDISHKAGIPKPQVYIIPTQAANAFATGRNPKHAVVACTEGILHLLTHDELKGVLAHEVSHVKNRDILISSIAAVIAGAISFLANMAQWSALFGGRDNERGGNLIGVLAIAIITPIIATIIHLAISRSREYLADHTGATTIRDSESLARALEKLERGAKHQPLPFGSDATAHLFIVHPFKGHSFLNLLSTHPPMGERIKRLRAMKF